MIFLRKEKAQGSHIQAGVLDRFRPNLTLEGELTIQLYNTMQGDWDKLPYVLALYPPLDTDLTLKLLLEIRAAQEESIDNA